MTKQSNRPKRDIQQEITDRIIKQLETANVNDWEMPWLCMNEAPINAVSKKAYRGLNNFWLCMSGYPSATFATFKQWQELGAKVKKGEKAWPVIYFNFIDIEGKDGSIEKTVPFMKHYNVFAAEQVDGYEIEERTAPDLAENNKHADQFFQNLKIDIKHGEHRAYYKPTSDYVNMPPMEFFINTKENTATENYYSTLAHECTHATGHENRLNRPLVGQFQKAEYAKEELIAELGAAFIMQHLGIENQPREDHAQYLKSWLRVLKNDKKFIFRAASQAQKALDWMTDRQPVTVEIAA